MDAFIATILMFGGNFDPDGWEYCNGQFLPIMSNSALYALLGTTYGGNGQTNFQLPDMRGRVPMHAGQGPGLSNHTLGEKGGVERVALTPAQSSARPGQITAGSGTATAVCIPGASEPHSILPPYLCVNFIICTAGIFPSRK
jgi:microcystin-dependent protein